MCRLRGSFSSRVVLLALYAGPCDTREKSGLLPLSGVFYSIQKSKKPEKV